MPDAQWYYAVNGEQLGPVSTAEMRDLIRAGSVGPADLVWCEGMADWLESSSVKTLNPIRRVVKRVVTTTAPSKQRPVEPMFPDDRIDTPAQEQPLAPPEPMPSFEPPAATVAAPPVIDAAPPLSEPAVEAEPSLTDEEEDEGEASESSGGLDAVLGPDSDVDMFTRERSSTSEAGASESDADLSDGVSPAADSDQWPAPTAGSVSSRASSSEATPTARSRASARGAAEQLAVPSQQPANAVSVLALWVMTALLLMSVLVAYALQWKKAPDAAAQTAAATTSVVWFVAIYCVARACERILQILGQIKKH